MPSDQDRQAYREAFEAWSLHLQALHAFLLDGQRPRGPDAIKGLLNREARSKERYEEARRRLLGIE